MANLKFWKRAASFVISTPQAKAHHIETEAMPLWMPHEACWPCQSAMLMGYEQRNGLTVIWLSPNPQKGKDSALSTRCWNKRTSLWERVQGQWMSFLPPLTPQTKVNSGWTTNQNKRKLDFQKKTRDAISDLWRRWTVDKSQKTIPPKYNIGCHCKLLLIPRTTKNTMTQARAVNTARST